MVIPLELRRSDLFAQLIIVPVLRSCCMGCKTLCTRGCEAVQTYQSKFRAIFIAISSATKIASKNLLTPSPPPPPPPRPCKRAFLGCHNAWLICFLKLAVFTELLFTCQNSRFHSFPTVQFSELCVAGEG